MYNSNLSNYASYIDTNAGFCNDRQLSTSSSSKGNKKLSNPIGLITADEVSFAGGHATQGNSSYYFYNGQSYWTMSPSYFLSSIAHITLVYKNGNFNYGNVSFDGGVRL